MRLGSLALAAALISLSACNRGAELGNNAASNAEAPAEQERVENLPPRDEGYAISVRAGFVPNEPEITVDSQYSGRDRTDLEAYAAAAIQALTSATTGENATALDPTYRRVWLNEVSQYEGLGSVGGLVRAPRQGFSYLPTRLVMTSSGTGAAESRDPGSTTGGRLITIRRYHLDWWRSANAVTRSCAINTLAHEMTHNMTRDPNRFLWAFTDTGLGGSVTGEKGSYSMGALAQCTYLQSIGRIDRAGIAQCVPVWGLTSSFSWTHCDDFDDREPVQWPKARPPGT